MKKFTAALLSISLMFSTFAKATPAIDNNVASNHTPSKKIATSDCVSKVVRSDTMFQVKTKNGLELTFFLDALKRAEVFRVNGKSFQLKYDKNIPKKVISVKSIDDGAETSVAEGLPSVTIPGGKEKLSDFASKIKLCGNSPSLSNRSVDGSMSPANHEEDGGHDPVLDTPEPWEDYGFYEEWTTEEYWIDEQSPYFEEVYQEAYTISRDETRSCVDRYGACNDTCDFQSDARSVSCAVGALVFIELPIGSALFAIACMGASWYHKNECKGYCGNLGSCF